MRIRKLRKLCLFTSIVISTFLCTSCTNNSSDSWSGYTVGDFVYVSAPFGGRLERLLVAVGDKIAIGTPLFDLDAQNELAIRAENEAKLKNAKASTENLGKGKRSEEIHVIEAQLAQAESALTFAKSALTRDQLSYEAGGLSKANLDDAVNTEQQAVKKVEELKSSLGVAKLPARSDEIAASRASTVAAQNALQQSEWQLSQKHQSSVVQGVVYELFYRVGEYVAPAQPVLSILSPENIKVRFYVSEFDLPKIELGLQVRINCDGCTPGTIGKVTRIATQAEFTPPVIYSNTERNKLMFLIEAHPLLEQAMRLRPGQPVQVSLVKSGQKQ